MFSSLPNSHTTHEVSLGLAQMATFFPQPRPPRPVVSSMSPGGHCFGEERVEQRAASVAILALSCANRPSFGAENYKPHFSSSATGLGSRVVCLWTPFSKLIHSLKPRAPVNERPRPRGRKGHFINVHNRNRPPYPVSSLSLPFSLSLSLSSRLVGGFRFLALHSPFLCCIAGRVS